MRLLSYFTAILCTTGIALSATTTKSDKLARFQSLSRSTPIDLDDSIYNELTSAPRDYYVAVMLTATDARFGCALCREFQPEWDLIAKSWSKGQVSDINLIFGTLDFSNGKDTFRQLMLQTAPVVLLFPPTVGPGATADGAPQRFDLFGPTTADQVYVWITRHLPEGSKPQLVRPINYMRLASAVTLLLGAITLFTVTSPYVIPIIQNRNIWAAISLIAILLFTSGHMFNHIRKVPYVAGDGRGGISYFAGGFSNQFGMETQIVAAMFIALALRVPRMADAKTQQLAVIIWGVILLGIYSFLLSVFRVKNGGYPFYLPPF
uniref:Magnesium transporter protein 1 n=1 Tax=Talaromyces marneffei PM1 TaxID=1077442 RepID=A0A093VMT7_TALMA